MILRLSVSFLLLFTVVPARAATFVVTTVNDSGPGSLHQAILDANATVEPDTIEFSFINVTLRTIAGNLPPITNPVTIDGYSVFAAEENTETGDSTNANLRIRLSAVALTALDEAVLDVQAGSTTIRGLIINDMPAGVTAVLVRPGALGVKIQGCFIGTNGSGLGDASSGDGIRVDGNALIGGPEAADRNLIAGNTTQVELRGEDSLVVNNLVGVSSDGGQILAATQQSGVIATGPAAIGNRVGGTGTFDRNVIAWHAGAGVSMTGTAVNLAILGNSIYENGALGIDLAPLDAVNPNDPGDTDTGPNQGQNFPVITFARENAGDLRVEGYLESEPGSYRVELFRNAEEDGSDHGEGETPISSEVVVIEDGQAVVHFAHEVIGIVAGEPFFVTATATAESTGRTSEFGRSVAVVEGGLDLVVTNASDGGDGSLRGAIELANANEDTNTIVFQIPSELVQTIPLASTLTITAPVIVDGYSQGGSQPNTAPRGTNANLRVVLDGDAIVGANPILDVRDTATIRGLVIHRGGGNGIELRFPATNSVIEGNFVGTDQPGAVALGNVGAGVAVLEGDTSGTTIGGLEPHHRNLISGNTGDGVLVEGSVTTVLGNVIGMDAAAAEPLGNGGDGIVLDSSLARVGRSDGVAPNIVRHNGGAGVRVTSGASNSIQGNEIDDNDGLGIDLGATPGVTPNDAGDADTGPNGLQNFPVITSATNDDGSFEVAGTLDTSLSGNFRFVVHTVPACDPSGFGEGRTRLGSAFVFVDANTDAFELTLPAIVPPGTIVTATATDDDTEETSEFSACFESGEDAPVCGDATGDEDLTAGDALAALRTAVGTGSCAACICDVNGVGGITTSDALQILRASVGQSVGFACPDCD